MVDNTIIDEEKLQEAFKLVQIATKKFDFIYNAIFGHIAAMLSQAKLSPMWVLRENEPTFSAMVSTLETYHRLCGVIAREMGFPDSKISEISLVGTYLKLARDMAAAIDNEDYDALCASISALDEKPYI